MSMKRMPLVLTFIAISVLGVASLPVVENYNLDSPCPLVEEALDEYGEVALLQTHHTVTTLPKMVPRAAHLDNIAAVEQRSAHQVNDTAGEAGIPAAGLDIVKDFLPGQAHTQRLFSPHFMVYGILLGFILVKVYDGLAGTKNEKADKQELTAIDDKLAWQKQYYAIDFARFLGAICIVNYHLIIGDKDPLGGFWISFFIITSGLGSATSRLSRTSEEELLHPIVVVDILPCRRTLWRRVASVYPTHLFALALQVYFLVWNGHGYELSAKGIIQEALLMGVFSSKLCCPGYPYNFPDWFLGALAVCWVFENLVFHSVARLFQISRMVAFLLVCATLWALTMFDFMVLHKGVAWWTIAPTYSIGVALAFALKYDQIPKVFRSVGASASVLLMTMLSITRVDQLPFFANQFDAGLAFGSMFLPVTVLFLIGLCGTTDPLSKLFASKPLVGMGTYFSMTMYLLQFPAISFWKVHFLGQHMNRLGDTCWEVTLLFLSLLAVAAGLTHHFIQIPLQRAMLSLLNREPSQA